MDTEKRLVLCFALSMLIIFAFSWLNSQKAGSKRPGTIQSAPTAVSDSSGVPPSPDALSTPTQTAEIRNATQEQIANAEKPSPENALTSWNWLPSDVPQEASRSVIVESSHYQVTFSTRGAIPISWKLLDYKELLDDPRYLKLQTTHGPFYLQEQAHIELELLEKHQNNGPHFVEAIDTLYPEGEAGFQIRWGKNQNDGAITYTCAQDRISVNQPTPVKFVCESNGLTVEKIYTFLPDSYHVELDIRIINKSGKEVSFNGEGFYDLLWRGGYGFPSLRKDAVNNVLVQLDGSTTIAPFDQVVKEIGGKINALLPEYTSSQIEMLYGKNVGWIGVGQKYFMAAIVPKAPTQQALKGVSSPDPQIRSILKADVGVRTDIQPLGDGETYSNKFILYVGPINEDDLSKAGEGLDEARQIFLRSIVGPIAHIMLRLLQGMYKIVPNYGLVIIVLTLLMKILMFPIYQKQIRTTKKMQALQPQINALKEKYKNDAQKLQKEQMELFRKHKVNPLSGCLTMLTTIPIFIALYATFAMAVELRGAPFIGWIQDLSAPDGAFFIPLGSYIIPVNILPIAYAALMLWSTSQQTMEGPNATAMKIMPLIFVFFFWSIASGVILYFVVSIFLDVMQRVIMDKIKGDGLTPVKTAKAK